jgi:acetyl-CoA carboxylase, biotin carboxylase subunit
MFRRILVANRGEVAARIIRTCKRLGIETVAVASDADADLQYLNSADIVAYVSGVRGYLDLDEVIQAGVQHACSAVHPGWGFLSENPTFAARCESVGMTFVGPTSANMRQMADKAEARAAMHAMGVPTIPGSPGALLGPQDALDVAEGIGYPVLLKAVSGGGGRGMRIVRQADEMSAAFSEAGAEALGAFADGRLYLEKLIENGRHIEFQIVGDGRRVQVLGERECSIQRRHQKLLEETPSPGLMSAAGFQMKEAVGSQVARACESIGYRGAGTIEMLLDAGGELYFMEMNTRLQVEHTVTEAVTGCDLVEAQLRVAANESIEDVGPATGWAIQCRINAEDPAKGFQPQPGLLERLVLPAIEGVRYDTHLCEGDSISPHYDSMIAKVIAVGRDRTQAIERMRQALDSVVIAGVPTTVDLHRRLMDHPGFVAGDTDTGFLERELEGLLV